jgi:heme exporter protein C
MKIPRLWYKLLAIGLLFYVFVMGFLGTVPRLQVLNETIRSLYFHVPMWFGMLAVLGYSVFMSIRYLMTRNTDFDIRAFEAAKVGAVMCALGLITGAFWANYTWGEPWSNDPKQQNSAVALVIYLAYLLLHRSFENPSQGARISAVYNIFAFALLIPLLFILPRMQSSLHPGADGNPAFGKYDLNDQMRYVFYPAVVAWTLLAFWIVELAVRVSRQKALAENDLYSEEHHALEQQLNSYYGAQNKPNSSDLS